MEKIVRDRSVRLNALVLVLLGAGTVAMGGTFPWVFAVLWVVLAVTASVAVVRAVKG